MGVDGTALPEEVMARPMEFIELDDLAADFRRPLQALRHLLNEDRQAEMARQVDVATGRFLTLLAAGLAREKQR